MNLLKVVVPVILIAVTGCKKKEPAPVVATPAAIDSSGAAVVPGNVPQPIAPAPPHIAAQAENSVQAQVTGVADPFLTSQLRIFIKDKGRLPQSFTEFTRTRLDSLPRAPEGSKWVIDSVSKEVKAVKK